MADRFQNALLLTPASGAQCGRTFSRWLVEFATQICGWTLIDDDGGAGSPNDYDRTIATGATGQSVAATPQRFQDSTGTPFASAQDGDYLTITGMPAGFEDRNGIYRIVTVIDDNNVDLDIRFSVHDAGIPHPSTNLSWRLWRAAATYVPGSAGTEWAVIQGTGIQQAATYNFQVRILQQTGDSHFPRFEVGPFANWNTGTNSWDSANTAVYDSWYASSVDNCRIWAAGDSDRIVVAIRQLDNTVAWNFLYIGEFDAFYDETIDPNPVLVWHGNNTSSDLIDLFGAGYNTGTTFATGGRMVGADNATTVTAYASFFNTGPTGNGQWRRGLKRRWNMRTRRIYRQAWIVESRTTGLQEYRGALRRCWISPQNLVRGRPFGRNAEFLHTVGGATIPWNGSGQHEERVANG